MCDIIALHRFVNLLFRVDSVAGTKLSAFLTSCKDSALVNLANECLIVPDVSDTRRMKDPEMELAEGRNLVLFAFSL